ncbi:MAG: hypothetical protein K8R74_05605 [Bacteroidales bacterium]|nr:hypothetical protein [Bacteroidales bacterium]
MPLIHHDYLIPIEENSVLWRYIDFRKFKSLLVRRSLFFCRANKFSDPFECSIPKEESNHRLKEYSRITNSDERKTNRFSDSAKSFNMRIKSSTIINCWHINNSESDAMWRIYLKTNEGVAIQTNPLKLMNALRETQEEIYTSKVRYIDFDKDIWYDQKEFPYWQKCSITPIIHKRLEFKSESEFRLFYEISDSMNDIDGKYWEGQENKLGKFIKVDVNELIDKVVFPPTIDEQTKNRIKKLVDELKYKFEFNNSTLNQNPLY